MSEQQNKRLEKLKKPDRLLLVSSSPHVHNQDTIGRVMWTVVLSLVPASLAGFYFFGLSALLVMAVSVAGCVAIEAAIQKMRGRPVTISDGSAVVTGVLLAMNLPAGVPWWMVLIGASVAIVIGKQVYGGLGQNIFNPALVARVFLLISFPLQMTTWPVPKPLFSSRTIDAVTGATPLGAVKEQVMMQGSYSIDQSAYLNAFWGNIGGSLGEISALALLLGAAVLIYKKYITWQIPVSFIGTVLAFAALFNIISPERYPGPLFHLLTGGLILGAFFMATDMVTSPLTGKGQLIFGFGCGLITIVIRLFGGYPEGVSFAILLMNAATPLIDRWTVPRKFGYVAPPNEQKGAPA